MTRPKLVAFDLDDTLIGSDGKIAPANFCALEQLSAAGVTAAAVTGRTFYEMPAELRFNPLVPYAVYGDGAAAVNAAGEALFSSYYSREKALAVLHLLRQYDTMIEVFYGGRPYAPADKLNRLAYDYYRIEPIYHPVMAASRVPCTDLEALLVGEEKTEMFNIFFHLDDERRAFMDRATELFPELICTYSMQSNLAPWGGQGQRPAKTGGAPGVCPGAGDRRGRQPQRSVHDPLRRHRAGGSQRL